MTFSATLPPPVRLRALVHPDLADLLAVQRACYGPGFVESAEVFARRLASPANCSLVLERDGQVCAYLAAYRSALGKVTPLHGDFEAVPQADTLYLHDMAVLPTCAGQGLAQALPQTPLPMHCPQHPPQHPPAVPPHPCRCSTAPLHC